jgi:hypothetical protein
MIPRKIGEYTVNIDKPVTGRSGRNKHIYMQLNLTDFDGQIREDVMDYQADIIFLAIPR